jgi:hypothetical protein
LYYFISTLLIIVIFLNHGKNEFEIKQSIIFILFFNFLPIKI